MATIPSLPSRDDVLRMARNTTDITGQLLDTAGNISGTTSTLGTFPFTAQVTDSVGNTDTQALSLTVTTTSQNNAISITGHVSVTGSTTLK